MSDDPRGRSRGRGRANGRDDVRRPDQEMTRSVSPPPQSGGRGRAPHQYVAPPATPSTSSSQGRGVTATRYQSIATRPSSSFNKMGSAGKSLNIVSNYFELVRRPDMKLFQYRIDFLPEIEHIGLKRALVRVHENVIGKFVFDGTLLYTTNSLKMPMELFSNRKSDNELIKITLRLVGEISKEDDTYLNVMNIILRRCLAMLNLTMIKRNYFDPAEAQPVRQHGLTVWPGYLTSIRHHETTFLLGVEIVNKVMRDATAYDVMESIRQNRRGGDIANLVKTELEGKIVMTHYNNRTYRIDDVDFSMNPNSTFPLRKEDREISYLEYYKTRYNLEVRFPLQPLLVSKPTKKDLNRGDARPVYLVPELCGMTGLTEDMRKNFTMMKELDVFTKVEPDRRVASLMRFRHRLQNNEQIQQELKEWGLQFAPEIIQCRGRQIVDSDVAIIQDQQYNPQNGDWSRLSQGRRMAVTASFNEWAVFYPRNENKIRGFVSEMKNLGDRQNFRMPEPKYIALERDQTQEYVRYLRDECERKAYSIVMVVMRNSRADTYGAIKKILCCEVGVPSQVITGRNLNPGPRFRSTATKVMVQMASKMGAEPWRVSLPPSPPGKKWMVIGYDTYHDARQRKAVGAFVATTNKHFTRLVSSVSIHEDAQDISASFNEHLHKCLKSFYLANKDFPTDIFVYRDGVGAGDIERVKEIEIASMRNACREISSLVKRDVSPNIAFIVVSKRINTRFFAQNGSSCVNPPCGMVVDNTVTLHDRYDFFLVSQKANRGTVSPTSFNIIEDTTGTPPDVHQRLAYAMTHLYFNWTGTLRVPAVVQYAHKLAYLIGEHKLGVPHTTLSTLPYYL